MYKNNQPFKVNGYFWLPSIPNLKYAGEIEYSPTEAMPFKININGSFSSLFGLNDFDVINCYLDFDNIVHCSIIN
jgi:hypothetical protein